MGQIGPAAIAIVSGILGLAIVAVLVSKQSQTPTVIQQSGSALASIIGAATAPVTGNVGNMFGSAASGALGAIAGGTLLG